MRVDLPPATGRPSSFVREEQSRPPSRLLDGAALGRIYQSGSSESALALKYMFIWSF